MWATRSIATMVASTAAINRSGPPPRTRPRTTAKSSKAYTIFTTMPHFLPGGGHGQAAAASFLGAASTPDAGGVSSMQIPISRATPRRLSWTRAVSPLALSSAL